MCGDCLTRRSLMGAFGAAAIVGMAGGFSRIAVAEGQRVAGTLTLKRTADGGLQRPGFVAKAGQEGGVVAAGPQLFYLDPKTEAEFVEDDDGLVTRIVLKAGGMLSLFGPSAGAGVEIVTPNASGAIRGTTTYFAWQQAHSRTYLCCCYGAVDVNNAAGGSQQLRTSYHNAIIMPSGGGVEAAPYDRPLDHFDDDIARLEAFAGRAPRWQLPDGRMHFLAPDPVVID